MKCEDWSYYHDRTNAGNNRYISWSRVQEKILLKRWLISHRGRKTEVKKVIMFTSWRRPATSCQSRARVRLKYDRVFYDIKIKGRLISLWKEEYGFWDEKPIAANSHAVWSKTDYRLPKKTRQKERVKLLDGGCYD